MAVNADLRPPVSFGRAAETAAAGPDSVPFQAPAFLSSPPPRFHLHVGVTRKHGAREQLDRPARDLQV